MEIFINTLISLFLATWTNLKKKTYTISVQADATAMLAGIRGALVAALRSGRIFTHDGGKRKNGNWGQKEGDERAAHFFF